MRQIIPLAIVTLVMLLIDWYAFQAIRTAMQTSGAVAKRVISIAYWTITAITLFSIYYAVFFDYQTLPSAIQIYLFGTLLIFFLPKLILVALLLIDDLIRISRWSFSKFTPSQSTNGISRLKFLSQAGLLVSGFFLFQFVYGMVRTAFNYRLRRLTISLPNLPDAFHGWKIIQISDIHSGSFASAEPLEKAVELINSENADAVFFTGDLVNNISNEALPFISTLRSIKAHHGVFSVFGNHDYGDYHRWHTDHELNEVERKKDVAQLASIHQQLGWKLLRNEHFLLGENENQLAIIGIENWGTRFQKYGDMRKAYAGSEKAKVKLLLSHDPTHWDAQVTREFPSVDVTFSGHTHGFQFGVEIPGFKWSPAQFLYPHWAGLYQMGKQYLYVNRGLGFLAYPGRVGIAPEITVIELLKG